MYPTYAGPIGCFMLALWSHKYKVGHIDLIHRRHHNLLKPPENLYFPMCHNTKQNSLLHTDVTLLQSKTGALNVY